MQWRLGVDCETETLTLESGDRGVDKPGGHNSGELRESGSIKGLRTQKALK